MAIAASNRLFSVCIDLVGDDNVQSAPTADAAADDEVSTRSIVEGVCDNVGDNDGDDDTFNPAKKHKASAAAAAGEESPSIADVSPLDDRLQRAAAT
jgi:hypothetical protein